MSDLINSFCTTSSDGVVTTTSRKVAEVFGKEHRDVTRSIRDLAEQMVPEDVRNSPHISTLFTESVYLDSYGREQPEYLLTRDGFSLLAMGFTGREALKWKLKFLETFNAMEKALLAQAKLSYCKDPEWNQARIEVRKDFSNVTDLIKDLYEDAGKEVKPYVYSNEARLLRYAMTGRNDAADWNRDQLSKAELKILGKVERLDMRLLARNLSFSERKEACRNLVIQEKALIEAQRALAAL